MEPKIYVKGAGMTRFDYTQKPWWGYAYEAAVDALKDAQMNFSAIDAVVFREYLRRRAANTKRIKFRYCRDYLKLIFR